MASKTKKSGDSAKKRSRSHRSRSSGKKRTHSKSSRHSRSHRSRSKDQHRSTERRQSHVQQQRQLDASTTDTLPSLPSSRPRAASAYNKADPTRASSAALPSTHSSAHGGPTPSRRPSSSHRTREACVTIPRGLLPKQVPEPLRSIKCGGKAPPPYNRVPRSRDDLYARWRHAYIFGTAAPEDDSDGNGGSNDKSVALRRAQVSLSPPLEVQETTAELPPISQSGKTAAAPVQQRVSSYRRQRGPPVSTLPESARDSDSDSMEAWVDKAGYFYVSGSCVANTSGREERSPRAAATTAAPVQSPTARTAAARAAAEGVPESASSPLLSQRTVNAASPLAVSSLRGSRPPSVTPFLNTVAPLPSCDSVTTTPKATPTPTPALDESAARYNLTRIWTPSPLPVAEEDEDEKMRAVSPMQELYPTFSHVSTAGPVRAASAAPARRLANGSAAASESAEAAPSAVSVARGIPSMQDGLAPDPDLSDNDSRHLVSVSRLPGASGSDASLWPAEEDTDREMGNEIAEDVSDGDGDGVDRRYGWVSAPAEDDDGMSSLQSTENIGAQHQPQQRRATLQRLSPTTTASHTAQESSLLAMSRSRAASSPLPTSRQQQQQRLSTSAGSQHSDTARQAWATSQPRFRREGHSAAVIGAQRVLTLLLLDRPATQPTVTSSGTEVRLPAAVVTPGSVRASSKTVTVDEAVAVTSADVCISSALLREVAEEVCVGHCAAVLLSVATGCGSVGYCVVENTLGLLLAALMKRHGQTGDGSASYFKMETSIALVYKGRYSKDLIVNREEELGALAPTRAIANPLVGSWCDNTLLQSVRSGSQLKSLLVPVQSWLGKSPVAAEKAKEVVCIYVAVRQWTQPTTTPDPTLTLSSLLLYVSRAEDGAAGLLHNRAAATPLQRSLLRRVGDGCFTVAAACIGAADEKAGLYAKRCADASAVKNKGFVSGDARRYMATLREAAAKEALAREASADPHERLRAEQRLNLRNDLLRGLALLLEDPASCNIPFYPDRTSAREEAAERAAQGGAGGGGSSSGFNIVNTPNTDNNATSAGSMSSAMLVQSILSSPHAIRISSLAEAMEMFSEGRVRTVAIRSTKKACGYELMTGTTNRLVRVSDRATFDVDELLPRRILPSLHPFPIATHTSALCSLVAGGYNAALVSFDGRSDNVFASPVWYVLAEAMDRALRRTDVLGSEVRIALSVVRDSGEALDLLQPGAAMVPLQVSSSPLFGAAVHSAALHPVGEADTLRELLCRVAPAAAAVWSSNAFLHVLLVNVFRTEEDVVVSSLNLSVLGSHAALCRRILANGKEAADGDAVSLHPDVLRLHHGFLSGSAASVFLVSLNNAEDSNAATAMATTSVPLLTKMPLRSGSVQEFVRRTRNGLDKRRKKAESLPEAERAYLARMERRITEMLDDAVALLDPQTRSFPKAYLSDAPQPSEEKAQRSGAAAVKTKLPEALPPSAALARSPTEKERALRQSSIGNGAPASPPAASSSAANEGKSRAAATAAAGVSHPQWVLGLELTGSAAMEVQAAGTELEWAPTKERFDTDGILFYNSTQSDMRYLFTENCEALQRLRENACLAHSCAILGLVDGGGSSEMHVRTQPLWRSFTALVLNSAFQDNSAGTTWRDGSELHLRMCAVQDRTVLHDFLLDTEDAGSTGGAADATAALPARVALAVNPLFGPVVRNTTVMRAGNIQECQCVFRSGLEALNSLAGEYPSGTVVIASAVLKNVTDTDICFSSITALGVRVGKDLPALRDILAMDPKGGAPPSLYQYALRGPCHLLCLTTLDSSARVHCVEALRLSQGIRYGTAQPVPAGSLRTCLQQQQSLLASQHLSQQARANTENVVRQLTKMMSDPSAPIVIFPVDDDAGAPRDLPVGQNDRTAPRGTTSNSPATSPRAVGASNGGSGGGSCCRCTAVITTANRSAVATLDARTETNTVYVARTSYPFSEVVLRANNSAVLRPGLISSVVQRVQQGCNTALVVADGANSSAGAALLSKLVSLFIRNTGDNGHGVSTTLFMSITAVRFGAGGKGGPMVKDLFSAESQFYPLQVARSPFFGPCVDGARFSSLNRIGDVYLTLKDAQKACNFLKATLVVAIVLKQVTCAANGSVQDMLMSSLFSVINTAETSSGRYACSVFDDMLDQREAALAAPSPDDPRVAAWRSCLLNQAFGGDCFTYSVVGLAADADRAEAAAMLKFGSRLMQVPCRVPAKSSAVEVLAHAQQRLRDGPTSDGDAPGDALFNMQWDWREIAAEAEEMLKMPDNCKPRAFLCE